ncbi:hypothetical protein, partial [Aeromonas caviae]|uniref:hypothetical protein n=1 Tax=Aeromonas caviae TaxID=648 RepID=UPI0022824785
LAQKSRASLRLRQLLTGLRMRLEDMLVIRRLQHHPGPARWSMERIGSCNPGAVACYFIGYITYLIFLLLGTKTPIITPY